MQENELTVYELSISLRATWQAHSLSNIGNNGSNRLLPRRQLLADGTETDALSGNMPKHHHAMLTAEYFVAVGVPLCPACASRDGRRVAGIIDIPPYKGITIAQILRQCGLCDTHGFLVTGKNASSDRSTEARQRLSKHSLIEFSFGLALPEHHAESQQLITRMGANKEEGQMIFKVPSRSGEYASGLRYRAAGIGVDTDKWSLVLEDQTERIRRHRAILSAIRDQVLSPSGAQTATMLPHLTNLVGAIVVRSHVGRAPMYSALDPEFVQHLMGLAGSTCEVLPFGSISSFNSLMNDLINRSVPSIPPPAKSLMPTITGQAPKTGSSSKRGSIETRRGKK